MRKPKLWATSKPLFALVLVLGLSAIAGSRSQAQSVGVNPQEKVLHTFGEGNDGTNPGTMISDGPGKFYGTTSAGGRYGGGTVFQLTLGKNGRWTETILHNFKDKTGPGGLVLDAHGNLFGVTSGGGFREVGTAFELMPGANGQWTEKVLHTFGGGDGFYPNSPLILDAAGNLYGTTFSGGNQGSRCLRFGCGTVFELMPGANGKWTEKVLLFFEHPMKEGSSPGSGVIFDSAGNLYGTTSEGGSLDCGRYGCGTVFELTPNKDGTWTEHLVHFFHHNGKDGFAPGNLISDSAGNFYGTTSLGGSDSSGCNGAGCGTVFELAPRSSGGWTESVLYSFTQANDPYPIDLVFGSAGTLYGETVGGGSNSHCVNQTNCGTVFKLTLGKNNRWSKQLLHTFCSDSNCADGFDPSWLIYDGTSTLYGTISRGGDLNACGGYGCGVVYELKP